MTPACSTRSVDSEAGSQPVNIEAFRRRPVAHERWSMDSVHDALADGLAARLTDLSALSRVDLPPVSTRVSTIGGIPRVTPSSTTTPANFKGHGE